MTQKDTLYSSQDVFQYILPPLPYIHHLIKTVVVESLDI